MRTRPPGGRIAGLLLTASLTAWLLGGCADDGAPSGPRTTGAAVDAPALETAPAPEASSGPDPSPSPTGPVEPRVARTLVTGLAAPWGLDFLPDGDAVVTERDTRRVLRIDRRGEVAELGVVDEAAPEGEGGLLGVAVSPDFARDRLLYLYVTTAEDNRIVRARLEGDAPGRLGATEPLLTGIPDAFIHDGGRLAFGPDGHLYATTGDADVPDAAQDPTSLSGKILRITTEGEPAPGNPGGTAVYTLGHRNPQGLAFTPDGQLWSSEFGQNTFDELNRIEPGANYGWPVYEGAGRDRAYRDPAATWATEDASPSGLAYAGGSLWMAALRGERLWRIPLVDGEARRPEPYFVGRYGRLRTIAAAPDGTLWLTTSNRDGRGDPAAQDDRILVLTY
ncbi:sorbosone dehydrogenase family protein [Nocardioides sp.]|uniref:PQQ-dependent sugar dehydrogenase n=1 Tax=Nocardioides sp. TaxID=35761 RepID=UPI003515422C